MSFGAKAACYGEVGGLGPGATVLEIGCGTGQLTRSLLARGLRVTAIEPGARLIARARDQLADAGEVEFVHRRLEEAPLPHARYSAAFSGSAIHWVDPGVPISGAAMCRRYGRGWGAMSSRGGMPQTCLTIRRSPRCRRSWSTRPTRSTLCSERCRSGRGSHAGSATLCAPRITPSIKDSAGRSAPAPSRAW
jgi:SAM-dependent methyltransferase